MMANKFNTVGFLLMGMFFLGACQSDKVQNAFDSAVPSHKMQFFEIDLTNDTTLITSNKSMLVIPKCAFKLGKNVLENQKIIIEFAEFYTPTDFVEAHLQTESDKGELLESAGMFYFQAKTKDNQPLEINKGCEPLMRYGSKDAKPNMQLYKGNVENGNVVWANPQNLEKWLTPVPLAKLNLYADPTKKQKILNDLPFSKEPQKVLIQVPWPLLYCGIENNIIDTLYASIFEKTLIATREFELRMRCIHQSCSEEILQLYLSNLDKNLYEIDSLAFELLTTQNNQHAQNFKCFYQQKLTKVLNDSKVIEVYVKGIQKNLRTELQDLFYYTFEFSEMGWYNVDCLINNPNTIEAKEEFELLTEGIIVTETRVYCMSKNYNSIRRLDFDSSKKTYTFGDYFKYVNSGIVAIYAIVTDGKTNYSCVKEIELGKQQKYKLALKETTLEEIKQTLSLYGQPRAENSFSFPKNECCYYGESSREL